MNWIEKRRAKGLFWDKDLSAVVGCSPDMPCAPRCWASKLAWRMSRNSSIPMAIREKLSRAVDSKGNWTGKSVLILEWLHKPLHWRKPRVIATCWVGDLFYGKVIPAHIERVVEVVDKCPQHAFLFLTKQAHHLSLFFEDSLNKVRKPFKVRPNWWLGTTITCQADADERLPYMATLADAGWNTWVILEPMLGPVDLMHIKAKSGWISFRNGTSQYVSSGPILNQVIKQVILGGENSPNARPLELDWVRKVRDDCKAAGVPFFLKMLNGVDYGMDSNGWQRVDYGWGRLLDGRTHDALAWENKP